MADATADAALGLTDQVIAAELDGLLNSDHLYERKGKTYHCCRELAYVEVSEVRGARIRSSA